MRSADGAAHLGLNAYRMHLATLRPACPVQAFITRSRPRPPWLEARLHPLSVPLPGTSLSAAAILSRGDPPRRTSACSAIHA